MRANGGDCEVCRIVATVRLLASQLSPGGVQRAIASVRVPEKEIAVSKPDVSVIMTVYNGQRWLEESVDSVLNQTLTEFELLVVDDGSQDSTPAILGRYASADSRIRVIRQVNQGQAVARNLGIDVARGAYIAFMDADDVIDAQRLAVQRAFMDDHEHVACVGSGIRLIDEYGRTLGRITAPVGVERCRERVFTGSYYSMGAAVFCRRRIAIEVGGFRQPFRQRNDADFILRVAERYHVDNVRNELYWYRLNLASQSVSRIDEALWENQTIWELFRERSEGGADRLQRGERVESPFSNGYQGRVASMTDTLAYLHLGELHTALEEGRLRDAAKSGLMAIWRSSDRLKMIRALKNVGRSCPC